MKYQIRTIRRITVVAVILGLFFMLNRRAYAQDGEVVVSAVDTVWVLFAAFLVFFM